MPRIAPTTSAMDSYGACVANQKQGDLILLIDESQSLRGTNDAPASDPHAARVVAAKYLVEQLAGFSRRYRVRLNVSVAGFSAEFTQASSWTQLNPGGLAEVSRTLDSFRSRNNGLDTDYWNALEGSRRALAARNAGRGTQRCQAIVWFSDGRLSIEPRDTDGRKDRYQVTKPYTGDLQIVTPGAAKKAQSIATQGVCRPRGLADQLRASKLAIFAVGLNAGESKPADFDLMKSIAVGRADGVKPCGGIFTPTPGEFYLASDINGLLAAFDRVLSTPVTQILQVCQGAVNINCLHRFVLDSSIQSVHVFGLSGIPKPRVELTAPGAKPVVLPYHPSDQSFPGRVPGASYSYSWKADKSLTVDLSKSTAPAGWSGEWSLAFIDPSSKSPLAKSTTNVHISGDLFPAWVNAKAFILHSGEISKGIQLGLVDASDRAVDPRQLLGTLALVVSLISPGDDSPVTVATLDRSMMSNPLPLDLTRVPEGAGRLRLELRITTAGARGAAGRTAPGTALTAQVVDVPLPVAPPVGYPQLPARIDFGSVEGDVNLRQDLRITGPGCVWVTGKSPVIIAAPDDIGAIAIGTGSATTGERCVSADEGASGVLPLTLTTGEPGNGTINGTLRVSTSPQGEPDRVRVVQVPFTADLRKPLNVGSFWAALSAALILGPGIPVALLYLSKWLTARIPARPLLAQQIAVTIPSDQVLRDGVEFCLRQADLVSMVPIGSNGGRMAEAAGMTLQTRVGPSPFGVGYVEVSSPGRVGASSARPATATKGPVAVLPLAVHNHWVLLHDPSGPATDATVLLLVGGDAPPEVQQDLVTDLNRRGPHVFRSLRESVTAEGPAGGAGSGRAAPVAADPFAAADGEAATAPSPFDFDDDPSLAIPPPAARPAARPDSATVAPTAGPDPAPWDLPDHDGKQGGARGDRQ